MSCRVVQTNGLSAICIDNGLQRIANLQLALFNRAKMYIGFAALLRIRDVE